MKKIINIKDKRAIEQLKMFKKKKYKDTDVQFINVHLRLMNEILRTNIFDKNDLYINATSLWELMQEVGSAGTHNYHGLTENDIIDALNTINKPYAVFETMYNRYVIVSTELSHFNEQLFVVIELHCSLTNRHDANINKIVTIYPKSDIDKLLDRMNKELILYRKNKK